MNNIHFHTTSITKTTREKQKAQKAHILWFTGLSGSGKSTIANALELKLYSINCHTYLLDGDNIRHGLNKDLGFDDSSRVENIRRIGEVSKLFVESGLIVLCSFISPFKTEREYVKSLVEENEFIEIFVDTPLEECEKRDVKGLYKKARAGEIQNFTGIDSTYEAPGNPDISLNTVEMNLEECVDKVYKYIVEKGYVNAR